MTFGTSPYDAPKPSNLPWTEDRVELLKKLWNSGMSARQVAMEMGIGNRNAVLGKLHRLGVPKRGGDSPRTHPGKRIRVRRRPVERSNLPKLPGLPRERVAPPRPSYRCVEPLGLDFNGICSLTALTKETCRYPLWSEDKSSGVYCGCRVVPSLPYCGSHARLCYGERRT